MLKCEVGENENEKHPPARFNSNERYSFLLLLLMPAGTNLDKKFLVKKISNKKIEKSNT